MAKRAPKTGIPCCKCGARASRIYKTIRHPSPIDTVERRRQCLRCKAKQVTEERFVREF